MTNKHVEQKIVVSGILEKDGKLLMVQRGDHEELFPGEWEFPSGKVDFGEDAEAALVREFKEEVALDIKVGSLIRTFSYTSKNDTRHTIELVYSVTCSNTENIMLSEDHQVYEWMIPADFLSKNDNNEITKSMESMGFTAKEPQAKIDESTTSFEKLNVYTDGGSRGNPGPSASGYVIMTTNEAILEEGGEYLGITTNNQAEYQAVKLALEMAKKFKPTELNFFIDSLLVVNQMNGSWKIKNKDLWPIHQAIKDLLAEYEKVTFTHVRREYNTLADEQVNIVLDSQENKA